MGNHYPIEFKQKVIDDYNLGTYGGRYNLAKHYNILVKALNNWIDKDRKQGNQKNDIEHKRGRPKEENIDYKERGIIFNHKKVKRIMNKYNIKPNYIKRIKNYKYKRIEANVKPNLVKRNFNVEIKNQIWVTDITYLIFNGKRAYLSTILD